MKTTTAVVAIAICIGFTLSASADLGKHPGERVNLKSLPASVQHGIVFGVAPNSNLPGYVGGVGELFKGGVLPGILQHLGSFMRVGASNYFAHICGCAVRNVFWEGRGLGEGARQGSVRRDCTDGAAAALTLVTAAGPRVLRIYPCEKKSKRDEPKRAGQRSAGWRESRRHGRFTFYSGNAAAKFAKEFGFG